MALHDSAKMFNYVGWKNTCMVPAIVFIITQLAIPPSGILHCTLAYPLELCPAFPDYYFIVMMGVQ